MEEKQKETGLAKFTRKNRDFSEQSSFSYGGRIQIAKPKPHSEVEEEMPEPEKTVANPETPMTSSTIILKAKDNEPLSGKIIKEEKTVANEEKVENSTEGGQRGRPKISEEDKKNKAIINFQISKDLKMKLEELRIKTYRTSITAVMIEAINDVLKKYGME